MTREIQLWRPSTISSPEQMRERAQIILKAVTSPQEAIRAAKQLVGCFPHAKPLDPEVYAGSLAAVLAQYPLGVVKECVDPRTGLARNREFPPTVYSVVVWCDDRLQHHKKFANYVAIGEPRQEKDFSPEHCENMLARLSKLMHEVFDRHRNATWVRPRGPFEK